LPDDEEIITGYGPLEKFLKSKGYKISKSSLQKIGMPSAGGDGPPIEGYWDILPAFKPSLVLEWARARIRPASEARAEAHSRRGNDVHCVAPSWSPAQKPSPHRGHSVAANPAHRAVAALGRPVRGPHGGIAHQV
jgi:hypothetical protein